MINGLTKLFYILAVISLLLCMFIYNGNFNVGHGGIPLIVIYTSAPATMAFLIILIISLFKIEKTNKNKQYYLAILLNIIINMVSSYAMFRYGFHI